MQIGLVEGIAPREDDETVIKAIKAAKRKVGGAKDTTIAVMNESCEIYRYATLNGLQQLMELAYRLEVIGLTDRTDQGERKPRGIFAVFGPPLDLSLEAVLAKHGLKKS